MNWIGCAATCAAKCSRRQNRKASAPEKYDETTAAMIALLKYGSGMPFYRLEKLEHLLGIPLPASTQWEIVEEAAEVIKAARDELIRQAAQGEVLHNDDTSMRVLRLAREPSDDRTGVFTTGIVSTQQGQRIALYFTGRQHAGENLRDVLRASRRRTRPRRCRCVMRCRATRPNSPTARRSCWPTVWRMEDGSLWKSPQTSRNHAAMFWKRWAAYINMMRRRARAKLSPAGAPAVSSAAQRPGDGATARVAGSAVRAEASRAQLGLGQSHHLFTAPLERADGISARSRRAAGQQHLRTRAQTRGAASQECAVLSHAARRRSRRSVHEPDPHLRAERTPIPSTTSPSCSGTRANWQPILRQWMPWNYRETLARLATPAAA